MSPDSGTYRCFACEHELDAAMMIDDPHSTPAAGDPSLCIRCGALAVFTGSGVEIRPATAAELVAFNRTPEVRRARGLLLRMWAEIGRPSGE